jgi:hypothetical protein
VQSLALKRAQKSRRKGRLARSKQVVQHGLERFKLRVRQGRADVARKLRRSGGEIKSIVTVMGRTLKDKVVGKGAKDKRAVPSEGETKDDGRNTPALSEERPRRLSNSSDGDGSSAQRSQPSDHQHCERLLLLCGGVTRVEGVVFAADASDGDFGLEKEFVDEPEEIVSSVAPHLLHRVSASSSHDFRLFLCQHQKERHIIARRMSNEVSALQPACVWVWVVFAFPQCAA